MRKIAIALLVTLLVPAADASQKTSLANFASPFQAEGDSRVQAAWVIVEFNRSSFGSFSVELEEGLARLDYHNATTVSHEFHGYQQYRMPPTDEGGAANLGAFGMSWSSIGSVAILADSLNLDLHEAPIEFRNLPPDGLGELDDSSGLDDAVSTWVSTFGTTQIFGQSTRLAQLSVSARNVRAIELIGATIDCSSICPTGGFYSKRIVGDSMIEQANFERITSILGSVEGSVVPLRVRFGGPQINLDITGDLRLPRAIVADCSCLDGQSTLSLVGSVSMSAIAPADGDRMSASISGDGVRAFRDESEIAIPKLAKTVALSSAAVVSLVVAFKLVILPLFTRLSKQEALEHPKRQKIFGYVQEHPGANFREIARNTGIASGTVRHHLTVLERAGHLVEHQHEGTVRLFENHGKFDHNWADVVLLREPPLAQVHDWLKQHAASPQKNILEAFEQQGWSRSTTQHRLARLVEGGLVSIRLQGRLKIYNVVERPAPKATLATPSFPRLLAG